MGIATDTEQTVTGKPTEKNEEVTSNRYEQRRAEEYRAHLNGHSMTYARARETERIRYEEGADPITHSRQISRRLR